MKMEGKSKFAHKTRKEHSVTDSTSKKRRRNENTTFADHPVMNPESQNLSEERLDRTPAYNTNELRGDSPVKELNKGLQLEKPNPEELLNSPYVAENIIDMKFKKSKKSKKLQRRENERTIFVGNVDVQCGKRKLFRLFSKYGTIEAIRFRSAAPCQPEVSKREAVIKSNIHPSRSTCNAYIRFKSKDMMEAALEANGEILLNKHLRVDTAIPQDDLDRRAAVFVGNLPFECEEEALYKHFEECGDIVSVRIIRDEKFSSGKGFGYVNFKSSDSVEVALQLDGKPFMKRNLRIQRCVKKMKQSRKERNFIPKEGEKIGFMKLKGERMSLKFMKKKKNNNGKDNFVPKQQKGRHKLGKNSKTDDFTGEKMLHSSKFKKGKRRHQGFTKEEKKKRFISRHLTGDHWMTKKQQK